MDKNNDNKIYIGKHNTDEVFETASNDPGLLKSIYREIGEKLGTEAAFTVYQLFRGTQVNFPVRFLDARRVKEKIIKEYEVTNLRTLAKKYGYSEKSVRRIIKESLKKEKE